MRRTVRRTLYGSEEQGLKNDDSTRWNSTDSGPRGRVEDDSFAPSSPLLLMCAMFVSATHSVSMASCHSGAEGVQVGQTVQSVIYLC